MEGERSREKGRQVCRVNFEGMGVQISPISDEAYENDGCAESETGRRQAEVGAPQA